MGMGDRKSLSRLFQKRDVGPGLVLVKHHKPSHIVTIEVLGK